MKSDIVLYAFLSLIGMALAVALAAKFMDDRALSRTWESLDVESEGELFEESMVAELPDPARRYLLRAIQPGTRLAETVHLKMNGTICLKEGGKWLDWQAVQLLSPPRGFIWSAATQGLMRLQTTDSYSYGDGRLQVRLLGMFPIVRADGVNVSRGQLGRLAIECVLLPSSLLPARGVTWEAPDDMTTIAKFKIDEEPIELRIVVNPEGRPLSATIERWSENTNEGGWGYETFGAVFSEEHEFGGYRIPSAIRAGRRFGTDRYFESFTATIDEAEFV